MTQDPSSAEKKTIPGINLLKLAKGRKFNELEAAWMDVLEQAETPWAELFGVPEYLVRSNEADQAVLLLWALVAEAREKLPPAEALALAKRAALIVPSDESLKTELAELYPLAFPEIPEAKLLAQNAGLKGATPAALAIERMERFLAMRPGTYIRDKNTGRVGRVEKAEAQGFALTLNGAPAVYDPVATDALEVLAPDDLRALALFEPERVESLRDDDPAELVRLALKTYGGRLDFKPLRERLTPALGSVTWTSWWAKAKEAIKRSPHIEMTDDAQPYLVLRRTPLSYQERIRRFFLAAPTPDDKFELILDYLRGTQSGQPAEKAVSEQLGAGLQQIAETHRDSKPIVALGALALLGEFRRRFPDLNITLSIAIGDVLAKIHDFSRIPAELKNEDVQLYTLAVIKDHFADTWPDIYAKLLPGCTVKICDIMARELIAGEKDRALAAVIRTITHHPDKHPDAFIWLWKTACGAKLSGVFEPLHRPTLTVALLNLGDWAANLNRSGDRETARAIMSQIRHTLAANDYRIIRGVIEQANDEEARHLNDVLNRNRFLSDYARNDITGILSAAHHKLFVVKKKPWEEDFIYTMQAGLNKRQAELERIVNVELTKVAEAIGRAIGYGDVSDNAEYRSALEQRDSLSKRAAQFRQEIAQARLVTPDMVKGDEVTVGAAVKTRNTATGEVETFTFLGPWDTDIPNKVYSYQAPFSLAFMGRRKGDIVTVPSFAKAPEGCEALAKQPGPEGQRSFEILEIRSFSPMGRPDSRP
jgi:transcription elongation GreA/GreB family factor